MSPPRAVATLIWRSPELLEYYRQLPERDRVAFVSTLVTGLVLAVAGAGRGFGAAADLRSGLGGLDVVAVVDGGWVAIGGDLALGVSGGARLGLSLVFATSAAGNLSELWPRPFDGRVNGLDAKGQWRAEERVRRAFGDLGDRSRVSLDDLDAALDLAERCGSNEVELVRRKLSERLRIDAVEVPIGDVAHVAKLAKRLGPELEGEVLDAIAIRVRSELDALKVMPEGARKERAIAQLRAVLDDGGLDVRTLLTAGRRAPPRETLSLEARRAIKDIEEGKATIHVRSKAEAAEVLSQFPEMVDTGDWGWGMVKQFLPGQNKKPAFHWDDTFGPDGDLLHHTGTPHAREPHLQLELRESTVRVFFQGVSP